MGRRRSACTRSPRASRKHQVWDFEHTTPDQYPLLLHFPYFDLYRKQVVKQADLVLALHVRGDAFTDEEKARDFEYYERADGSRLVALGVHAGGGRRRGRATSSSPTTTSREAALMDLHDLEHNTRDGVHIASLAGAWIAAVAGFGGMRDHERQADVRAAPARAARRGSRSALVFRGRRSRST